MKRSNAIAIVTSKTTSVHCAIALIQRNCTGLQIKSRLFGWVYKCCFRWEGIEGLSIANCSLSRSCRSSCDCRRCSDCCRWYPHRLRTSSSSQVGEDWRSQLSIVLPCWWLLVSSYCVIILSSVLWSDVQAVRPFLVAVTYFPWIIPGIVGREN